MKDCLEPGTVLAPAAIGAALMPGFVYHERATTLEGGGRRA